MNTQQYSLFSIALPSGLFVRLLIFAACLLAHLDGVSQTLDEGASLRQFGDSLRQALTRTAGLDTAVARRFDEVWARLGLAQKNRVKTHTRALAQARYDARTRLLEYYGALFGAANSGDNAQLNDYLDVAGKVIEREHDRASVIAFFENANLFFKRQQIHVDNFFQLIAQADNYRFLYIEDNPPLLMDISTDGALQDEYVDGEENAFFDVQDMPEDNLAPSVPGTESSGPLETPIWFQPDPLPTLTGPVLAFDRLTLHFATPYDTVAIVDTKGSLSLFKNIFVGQGGTFDWSSAGLPKEAVYFTFEKYYFDAKNPVIKPQQGRLVYPERFAGQVAGVFEFRSVSHSDAEQAMYPKFTSFSNNINMLGLEPYHIRYWGGFALDGKKILSRSLDKGYSRLEIIDEGSGLRRFLAQAASFQFGDSVITSNKTRVTIYHGNDSIYCSSVYLSYNMATHQLALRKEKIGDEFYFSSYFNFDFEADQLRWNVLSDTLSIKVAGSRGQEPLVLSSINFYDVEDFRVMTGLGFPFHPVALLGNYVLRRKEHVLYVDEIARHTDQRYRDVRMATEFLASKGMVDYEPSTERVYVRNELLTMFNAHRGTADYDNLKIHSVIDGAENATLSLNEGEMLVRGVDRFKVSDSLNVVIRPDSSQIILGQNRAIRFNGNIIAGNFEIYGRGFDFNYDGFLVTISQIDSIRIYTVEVNERGEKVRKLVKNSVEGAADSSARNANSDAHSGTLYINKPNNKSGRKKTPDYPRLDAIMGGVIYFDRKDILNGAYNRSVYYLLPPFKLDSLNNAAAPTVRFNGEFVSGGIFPPFRQQLYTREDNSLGFTHRIPPAGYPMFGEASKATGIIDLSGRGIRFKGQISYLTATIQSEDFTCYPDSVVGKGSVGTMEEKYIQDVSYPEVSLPRFAFKWLPKADLFSLANLSDPFMLYGGSAQLNGRIALSKKGLYGAGVLRTRGITATSRRFVFTAEDFEGRHTDFQLSSRNPDKPAIAGSDIRLKFSIDKSYADISPEMIGDASLEFPYAQFKTSIPKARWDLNTQKVAMKKDPETPLEESYFYTTRPDLDSLNFMATEAEYDIAHQRLKVSGIPFIQVADAKIIPQDKEILILENAKIGTLENAVVVLDTLNAHHRLINGSIDIISRNRFTGRATYQYVNAESDTFAVKMTDFRTEPIRASGKSPFIGKGRKLLAIEETVASGTITAEDGFRIAPRMFYKGNMTMYATRPALQLNGSIKLDLKKIPDYNTWIKYSQTGAEDEIIIPFDEAQDENGKRVEAGVYFDSKRNLYLNFVSDKRSPDDEIFFRPSGALFYDQANGVFRIEDRLRASGEKLSGKAFSYNDSTQEIYFAGKINFFQSPLKQKNFRLDAQALGSGNIASNEIKMNALLIVTSQLPLQAMYLMADDLKEATDQEGLDEGLGDQTELLYKIANLVGEKEAHNFEEQSLEDYVPLTTLSPLVKGIVFANINIEQSGQHHSFYNTGKLGLSNILDRDINGAMEGFLEINTAEDGNPVVHLFFRAAPYAWYYFGLEDNRLLVHSSNAAFNEIVAKKTNVGKQAIGRISFAPGSDEEVLAFVNRFRSQYYGIETPFSLESDIASPDYEIDADDDGF